MDFMNKSLQGLNPLHPSIVQMGDMGSMDFMEESSMFEYWLV